MGVERLAEALLQLSFRRPVLFRDESNAIFPEDSCGSATARDQDAGNFRNRDTASFSPSNALRPPLLEFDRDHRRRDRAARTYVSSLCGLGDELRRARTM